MASTTTLVVVLDEKGALVGAMAPTQPRATLAVATGKPSSAPGSATTAVPHPAPSFAIRPRPGQTAHELTVPGDPTTLSHSAFRQAILTAMATPNALLPYRNPLDQPPSRA